MGNLGKFGGGAVTPKGGLKMFVGVRGLTGERWSVIQIGIGGVVGGSQCMGDVVGKKEMKNDKLGVCPKKRSKKWGGSQNGGGGWFKKSR